MRPLIAGNWKIHGTSPQLAEIEAIATAVQAVRPAADILICPPSTLIARATRPATGHIAIGGSALALELIQTFLHAHFSGAARHQRRLAKVQALETGNT
jgi:triosephosphate isomerase